ncbi:unnamed protein product [Urochloa decumbens]|uniref:Uncharacterized protein n=1 Tax=Urochloa decumbens TaxID=240449 RepID=A0ABC9GHG4_9POAL
MGTAAEVLRPHDCLAHARTACRRPLRPAGRRTAAARHHHQGQRHGDIARGSAATAPRQVRTKVAAAAAADAYAGPAFGAMSPSPRALPLPRFTPRTAAACAVASEAPGVDDAATRELRRLLGLH